MAVGLILYVLGWFGQVRPDMRRNPTLYRAPLWLRIILGVPQLKQIEVSLSAVQFAGLAYLLVVTLAMYGFIPAFQSIVYLGVAIATYLLTDFLLQRRSHRDDETPKDPPTANKKQAGR